MNMEFENEPTDEQLDAMLRDVDVPSDLKSRLMQIPELTVNADDPVELRPEALKLDEQTQAEAKPGSPWLSYVLVASLLVVLISIAAQFLSSPDEIDSGKIASVDSKRPELPTKSNSADGALIVKSDAEIQEQKIRMLEAEIQMLKISKLESELAQLESRSNNRLDDNEIESMIMALAPEYSIPLGGNESDVRTEMARVMKEYPNTRGAVIAGRILNEIN